MFSQCWEPQSMFATFQVCRKRFFFTCISLQNKRHILVLLLTFMVNIWSMFVQYLSILSMYGTVYVPTEMGVNPLSLLFLFETLL